MGFDSMRGWVTSVDCRPPVGGAVSKDQIPQGISYKCEYLSKFEFIFKKASLYVQEGRRCILVGKNSIQKSYDTMPEKGLLYGTEIS
jgi:hypothetical protein